MTTRLFRASEGETSLSDCNAMWPTRCHPFKWRQCKRKRMKQRQPNTYFLLDTLRPLTRPKCTIRDLKATKRDGRKFFFYYYLLFLRLFFPFCRVIFHLLTQIVYFGRCINRWREINAFAPITYSENIKDLLTNFSFDSFFLLLFSSFILSTSSPN